MARPRTLNSKLRDLRESIGIPPEEVAAALGITAKSYSKIERTGTTKHAHIAKIAQVTGYAVSTIAEAASKN